MDEKMITKREKELLDEVAAENTLDFEAIRIEVLKSAPCLTDDLVMQAHYIGSILILMPSGKIYTAFANSNVEKCEKCEGNGCDYCLGLGSVEIAKDKIWEDFMAEKLKEKGLFLDEFSGDLRAVRCVNEYDFLQWINEKGESEIEIEEFGRLIGCSYKDAEYIINAAADNDTEDIIEEYGSVVIQIMNIILRKEDEVES